MHNNRKQICLSCDRNKRNMVKVNQYAKYIGQNHFVKKLLTGQTHTHTQATALRGPLKWLVNVQKNNIDPLSTGLHVTSWPWPSTYWSRSRPCNLFCFVACKPILISTLAIVFFYLVFCIFPFLCCPCFYLRTFVAFINKIIVIIVIVKCCPLTSFSSYTPDGKG